MAAQYEYSAVLPVSSQTHRILLHTFLYVLLSSEVKGTIVLTFSQRIVDLHVMRISLNKMSLILIIQMMGVNRLLNVFIGIIGIL